MINHDFSVNDILIDSNAIIVRPSTCYKISSIECFDNDGNTLTGDENSLTVGGIYSEADHTFKMVVEN